MSAAPLTPELASVGATIVAKLTGTAEDFGCWMEEHAEELPRAYTRAEEHALALYVDSKLGRCSDCEHLCPLGELGGEVEGGTCFSCR